MIAPQHSPQRHFLEKIGRPILFAAAGFASLITGFAGAALFDKNASLFIRAEGDVLDEGPNPGVQRSAVQGDSDVWPPLEYSFPQMLDVLSPEPLMSPVGSMSPSRADKAMLTAALTSRTARENLQIARHSRETTPLGASADIAPTLCLPDELRAVLTDLQSRFEVVVVSTTQLHTDNHQHGSIRAQLHAGCKAVDVRVSKDQEKALSYLRSRPEIGGINRYRNGVIHFDLKEIRKTRVRKREPSVVNETSDKTSASRSGSTGSKSDEPPHSDVSKPYLPGRSGCVEDLGYGRLREGCGE